MTAPTTDVKKQLDEIWEQGAKVRETRIIERRKPPLIRIWDGNWKFKGVITNAIEGKFQWKLNDTGTGYLRLPLNHWISDWALDYTGRPTKNVFVTMDKDGSRWGGMLKEGKLVKDSSGQRYLDLTFFHDYEQLKHIYVWPNPLTPAAVQFPRSFVMLGPTAWVLKTALMLNVWRLEGSLWALPNDPLDRSQWSDTFNPYYWAMQVKPGSIGKDTSPTTIISSRMKTWHDLAKPKLDEAQLMVECRRWLEGDPLPWPGAKVRNGCLIFDIVDKSSYWDDSGTATRGNIRTGFIRTIQSLTGSNIDTQQTIMSNPNKPSQYSQSGWLGTVPNAPYVVYRDGPITGVESAEFAWSPATCVQILTGGHSAPGVNEAISAIITLIGNYIGNLFLAPTLGTIADTFLKPLYTDTILAWVSVLSAARNSENPQNTPNSAALGWSHYWEHFADGADRGYTLASLVALRKGFWDTRERVSHKLQIRDGAPWFVGDQGKGHFFLGDRIGSTIIGLPEDLIVVEQVTELTYSFSRSARGWDIVCGDLQSQQSPLEKALSNIREATAAIHDLGVI